MSEDKKKVKWADIERVYNAFDELERALFAVDVPKGVTWWAIEHVRQAREEAGGSLLFAEIEDDHLAKECRDKMKLEWLEKKTAKIHDYCKHCQNSDHCGKGFVGEIQKRECDNACAAIRGRLELSESTLNKAMIEIAKEKYAKEMRWFFSDNKEATR